MKKYKVIFYSPGTFLSESSSYPIDSWDIVKAIELSEKVLERYNSKPYGFVFETILVLDDVTDGEGGILKDTPKSVDRSGVHFMGGYLETYDDVVARNDSKENILRDNMMYNEHWIICINTNSYRSTLPFNEKDCIVDARGVVIERGNSPERIKYRTNKTTKRDDDWEYEKIGRKSK